MKESMLSSRYTPSQRWNAWSAAEGDLDPFLGAGRHDILGLDASPVCLHAQVVSLRALPVALVRQGSAANPAGGGGVYAAGKWAEDGVKHLESPRARAAGGG